MNSSERIRELVNACLRAPDPEGDYGAIFALSKMCREGCSLQTLETIKRPLKNENDPESQIRMVNLLVQLVNNCDWNIRANLATEKWMTRLIDVAKMTRSKTVRDKILQMIVDWAAMYSNDVTLVGFQNFGVWKIANSKHLRCPPPSVSPGLQPRGPPRVTPPGGGYGGYGGGGYGSPGGYGSGGSRAYDSPYSGYGSPQPRPYSQKQMSPSGASYGVKTAAPPGYRAGSAPPGFQSTSRHRSEDQRLGDVVLFISDVTADVNAFNNALSSEHLAGQLPDLLSELETNRVKINEYLNKDLSEQTTVALCEVATNIDEAIECYAAITGDTSHLPGGPAPVRGGGGGGGSGRPQASSSSAPIGADEMEGADRMDAGDMEACSDDGMPPRDLSNNATAVQLGLVPQPSQQAMATANSEVERLRQQLRHKEEREQELLRELDEARVENETLKGQVAAAGPIPAGAPKQQIPPQLVAALKSYAHKSKLLIQRTREMNMEMAGVVETGRSSLVPHFNEAIAHLATLARRPNNEALIKKLQEDYLKERALRKEYYNKIQELRGNIRVFCRVRPLSNKEKTEHSAKDVTQYPDRDEIVIADENNRTKMKKYDFDRVYQPDETQEDVFVDTSPLIESVIDGYNVTIFAYGQTGSGKTYTMEGPPSNPGVYTRALRRLFEIIEAKKDTENCTVALSILEIYNEKIKDLLVDTSVANRTAYEVKTGGETGNYVSNLSAQHVDSLSDIDKWSAEAHKHRTSGKTNMNEHSSRSHMLLYFVVKTENIATGNRSYGKLSLIDLAGSERLKKSQATGQAATEASFINKSLSCLGDTIASLASGSKHVPYRNSKLTFLLQDSLSGNSKVLMFANISPADYNTTETLSTLDFAARARNTALGMAHKNKA